MQYTLLTHPYDTICTTHPYDTFLRYICTVHPFDNSHTAGGRDLDARLLLHARSTTCACTVRTSTLEG